jgi:hypothetical protein
LKTRRARISLSRPGCIWSGPRRGEVVAWLHLRCYGKVNFDPSQFLRHELAREGVPLIVIQRQLGRSNLGITSIYLLGIDNAEIIETVHARRASMVPVNTSLRL